MLHSLSQEAFAYDARQMIRSESLNASFSVFQFVGQLAREHGVRVDNWEWQRDLKEILTEAIATSIDALHSLRCGIALRHFQENYEETKSSQDGSTIAVFVMSVAHKTPSLTARYFLLLHCC